MITNETIEEVHRRSNGRCENPECRSDVFGRYEHHHIYWRSQYRGRDRDDSFNIAFLCSHCHYSIHSQGNIRLDRYLKALADSQRPKSERAGGLCSEILSARGSRKKAYSKKVQEFRQRNGGLSPTQVAYRKQKEYKNKQVNGSR